MQTPSRRTAVAVLALSLAALACKSKQEPAASSGAATGLDPAKIVAMVDGKPITAGELDTAAKSQLGKAEREYVEKVHQIRTGTLDDLVDTKVLEKEAAARGVAIPELLKTEVESAVPMPAEGELRQAYEQFVRPQYPNVSFEEAAPQIAQQVRQQALQAKHGEYISSLRAKFTAQVKLPEPELPRVKVAATGPAKGPEGAPVTIVEFSDFQCPYCSRAVKTVDEVVAKYGDKVRLVFRQYPLPFHENAQKAAEASLCAADQGKFWQMHDALFEHQDALGTDALKTHARTVPSLDVARFDACLDGGTHADAVKKDLEEGMAAGVDGTPAFFINGRLVAGALPLEAFAKIIDAELAK